MQNEVTRIDVDVDSTEPVLLALSDQLATALNVSLRIWPLEDARSLCLETQGRDNHAPSMEDDLLSTLQQAVTVKTDEGESLLLIPLASAGYPDQMAVGLIAPELSVFYERMASLVLENTRLNRDLYRLQHENQGLIRQVTDDLEELTFLRQVADHLKVSDASQGVAALAEAIQEMLNFTIQAEAIFFVEVTQSAIDKAEQMHVMCATGNPPIEPSQALAIVEAYQSRAVQNPLVLNMCRATLARSLNIASVHSLIICPITNSQTTYGWLLAVNRQNIGLSAIDETARIGSSEFGSSEATLLASAAAILATHMCNVDLFREKEALLTKMVRCLVSAIEAKDPYTCGHSERVAKFGKRLAELAGYPQEDLDRLYLSGLLHDIGKIAISDATLHKPTHLNDREFNEIKCHPDKGWAILHELDQLHGILPGVLYHHERIDGKGYPYQLKGEQIPLDGRILAVADSFDAMTSDRPYRKGMPVEKAVEIIRQGAGTQWDARLVDLFVENIGDFQRIMREWQRTVRPIPPVPPPMNNFENQANR